MLFRSSATSEQHLWNSHPSNVVCYALEGSYPDEVSYLEQNYGVVIDHAKYNVFYQSLGSNLKPEVAVYRKGAAR